jgi:hypothetical protein
MNTPIKANISTLSKSTFQHYYTDFIRPIQHRMKILHVSDPITIEYIFPLADNISIYSQLQTLFLENIESHYLEDLLHRLAVLPNLSSLTLHANPRANKVNIYKRLFQLPVLKYCELSFQSISFQALPISTSMSSPIEHLIIKDNCHLNEIDVLLSYVPQLRRLSIINEHALILVLILLNDLTQLSFTLMQLQSDEIDQFIKKRSHQIKVLHFSSTPVHNHDIETLKNSIIPYLPHVKIFQFHYPAEILCDYTFEMYASLHGFLSHLLCNVKQWFFTHKPMSDECLHTTFCSFEHHR